MIKFINPQHYMIGGGFPGTTQSKINFEDTAKVINESLDIHFPEYDSNGNKSKVEIIAEPGRYYVSHNLCLIKFLIISYRMALQLIGCIGLHTCH